MRVEGVSKESAAEKSGLIAGDILLAINGEPINDMLRLRQVLNQFEAGQEIKIKIRRTIAEDGDAEEDQPDVPGDEPEGNEADPSDPAAKKKAPKKEDPRSENRGQANHDATRCSTDRKQTRLSRPRRTGGQT